VPESSTTLFRRVRQVAVPYVRQVQCWVEFVRMRHRAGVKSAIYDCYRYVNVQVYTKPLNVYQ